MVNIIIINASLFVISLFAGMYTLFRHTDFPKGMTDDEIEKYRIVASNHSKKVKGCAWTTLALGAVFYVLIPALLIVFSFDEVISCILAVMFALVQMLSVLIVFLTMSAKLNV